MVKLSDGRELEIDMLKISMKEFRSLFDKNQLPEEEDAIIGRVCGLTADELVALPQPDYRRIALAFFDAAKEPLADPNSPGASISD